MESTPKKGKILKPVGKGSQLVGLVDPLLIFEKSVTAAKVRKAHLALNGEYDPETEDFLKRAKAFKEYLTERIAFFVMLHPAYHWFSRIRGIGNENIAKIIGLVNIQRAQYVSSLWKFAGYGVDAETNKAERAEKGKKLPYNKTLKTMCYRVGVALLKASAIGKEKSHYGKFYEEQYARLLKKLTKQGCKVVPQAKIPADAKPGEYMNELQLHQRAFRKMVKLFLSHLWLVWREAEGLSTNEPWVIAHGGHAHLIDPWSMVDRPAKKAKKVRKAS